MVWCVILWKAIKVRRAFNRLKAAKKNSYRQSIGLPPIYPIYERPFRWVGRKLKSLALNTFCRCCKPRKGKIPSAWNKLWMNGTLPNEVLKSIIGLIVGLFFSIILLNLLTTHLNFHAAIVYWSCIAFGVILTIGMTFSDTVRCLFVLGIPQLFNSKGRAALLAYLLVLALSGPAKNTAMNMEVLTKSLVCGQDMVRDSTRDLVELATSPLSALKNAVSVIITSVQDVLERMNQELKGIVKVISEIVNVIKKVYAMLKSVTNLCNDKLGTPFDRCIKSFDQASKDCTEELGPVGGPILCSVVDLFQNFCQFAKLPNLVFCWLPSLVKEHIIDASKEHFKKFADGFKKFFDVRLNITYNFDHELKMDKSLGEVAKNMKADIMRRVDWFLNYVDWMDLAISGFLLLVVWKAFSYRHKFLNSDEFDNYYITKGMIRMDLRRRRINKAAIFPLRYRECTTYVQTYSWALVKEERQHMQLALLFVGIAAIQILNYILLDYSLYLFLEMIRKYGGVQFDTKEALGFVYSVEGEGFLAQMYRSILQGLSPVGGLLPSFDTSKCLPVPHTPNYYMYAVIISLLFVCFLLATMEPYGLRLRHIVCGWIYEDRILKRETWLYLHILSRRNNFLDYAKGQLRANLKGDRSVFKISLMDRLVHTVPCCSRLFKTHKKKCFLCGRPGDLEDFEYFIECPNCKTAYCKECFDDMGQKCIACMKKIDYEELTDFSEEMGSDSGDSDEDRDLIEICCNRLCNCSSCTKKRLKKSASKPNIKNDHKSTNKFSNIKYQKLKERNKSTTRIKTKPQPTTSKSKKSPTKSKNKSSSNIKSPTGKSKSLPNKIKSKSSTRVENKLEKNSGWMSMAFGNFSSLQSIKPLSSASVDSVGGVGKKKKFGGVKYQKLKSGKSKSPKKGSSKSKSSKKHKSSLPRPKVKSKNIQEGSKSRKKSPNILSNEKKNKLTKSKAKVQKSQPASPTSKRAQSQFPREKGKLSPTKKSHHDPTIESSFQSSKSKPRRKTAEVHITGKNKMRSKKSKKIEMKEPMKEESGMLESPRDHFTDHDGEHEDCEECQRHEWWQRHTMESFRHAPRCIADSLQDRVDYLNEFYDNMPYPPHCNL